MTRSRALTLLGFDHGRGLTAGAVRGAYARAVRADHPDTGGTGTLIGTLQEARDFLIKNVAAQENACATCRGSGTQFGRFGVTQCGSCRGTGERRL